MLVSYVTLYLVNNLTLGGWNVELNGRKLVVKAEAGDSEFTYIPPGLEQFPLSGNEFSVYFVLLMSIGNDDRAEVSYSELAERTNTTRRTAIRALAGLEERGLVKRVKQAGDNGSLLKNAYEVYRPVSEE